MRRRPDPALQLLDEQLAAVRAAQRELRELLDVMWALQPAWLTEAIQHARRTGWTISPLGAQLRFARAGDECLLPAPLPSDAREQARLARDLRARLGLAPPVPNFRIVRTS
jgi:hypothetical protein